MKIKKFIVASIALLAVLFSTTLTVTAQANTVEPSIPTYGLYCENSELIKSGYVNFDFTDNELFSKGKYSKQSEYRILAANHEVEFAIPFVSSAMNLPEIAVTINGQKVEGSVWYGKSGYWTDYGFDIDNTYSPVLAESIMGTLYTFIPDSDTITVSLKLNEWKSYIYETTNYYSSSNSVDGSHTWTLRNASSLHEYSFFIFGDTSGCTFESSCGYKTETITCKEFIDNQYKKYEEYYDYNGGVPIELFYSLVNSVIQDGTSISYDELFLRSIDTYRVNAYKFKVVLESDSVIRYDLSVNIQINNGYKPYVYYVEQKQVGNYPVNYNLNLRDDVPYIIKSSETIERDSDIYTAETAKDFGFYFSASEKPTDITLNTNNGINRTVLIVCIIVGGVALIGIAVIIGITLFQRKVK